LAVLLLVSANAALRAAWGRALRHAGHETLTLVPQALVGAIRPPAAEVCLYDLGERRAADVAPLQRLLQTSPQLRCLAMSAVPEAAEGVRLLRAGVRGYCNRRMSDAALVTAVATVLAGEIWAGKQVTEYLLQHAVAQSPNPHSAVPALHGLTPREREIAELVGAGRSNKVIAAEAGVSERTVKAHLNAIFRKTGIRNRVQLALAVSQGAPANGRLAHG
jgi:DNA-binding NarL/FixJ family response regulator